MAIQSIPLWERVRGKPQTKIGWWAAWLAAAFVVLWLINTFAFMSTWDSTAPWRLALNAVFLPVYGILMMLCGVAAGVCALAAVIWKRERSWMVLLPLVPGLFAIFFILGEFLVPH